MGKKNSFQQKLAVAMSVVNVINAGAPVALPYVNWAGQIPATGGQITAIGEGQNALFYGTAQAYTQSYTDPVTDGQTVSNETVENGSQTVHLSGTAIETHISSGGTQYISGTAINTTILAGGTQVVYDSGIALGGTISGKEAYQNVKGTAKDMTVSAGGEQSVVGGGTVLNTTVKSGGTLNADYGSKNVLGGSHIVESGGIASGGTLMIVSGLDGTMTVADGGFTQSLHVGSGTTQTVHSGGTAVDITVEAGATQTIEAGGIIGGQNSIYGTVSGGTLKRVWVYDVEKEAMTSRDGVQNIFDGGTAMGVTVVGEYVTQAVYGNNALAIDTLVMSGGEQFLNEGGVAQNTIVKELGKQTVDDGGITSNTTVSAGGTQIVVLGGTANNTIVSAGGTQNFGCAVITTNPDTGKSETNISAGGVANGTIVQSGGVQNNGYVTADGLVVSGGTANDTEVYSGGIQNIGIGGTAKKTTINNGGVQNINSGGTTDNTAINNGGVQNINSGGTADNTTFNNGGIQHVDSGGRSKNTILTNGGTVTVDDYGIAQLKSANGGKLELLATGLAEAWLGDFTTPSGTTFTLTNAYARGDTVRLGLGDSNGYSAPGKSLVINNMDGYASFYINTDLANNVADHITIGTATNATRANRILINYDPTLATGTLVKNTNATFATLGRANTATFVGAPNTIGGYSFIPTLESPDNGLTWNITGVSIYSISEQMYGVLGNASSKAAYWRQAGAPVINHMALLRRDPSVGNDFWVNYTRGKNSLDNLGHDVSATYSRMDIGYDRRVNANWTLGASYGLKYGSEGYSCGSGDSHDDIITAYGLWQGNGGRYSEITLRAGRLASNLDLQDPVQYEASKGDNSTYGQALSFTYGQRMEKQDNWYIEPHVGLQWAHLNGYNYSLSDGSNVSVDASNSFIGNIGINVGQEFSKGNTFYARADLMHDFAGGVRATMTKGLSNSIKNDFKDTWLDLALGFKRQSGLVEWYIEVGRLGIGSKAAQGNWVWNVGMNYSF